MSEEILAEYICQVRLMEQFSLIMIIKKNQFGFKKTEHGLDTVNPEEYKN